MASLRSRLAVAVTLVSLVVLTVAGWAVVAVVEHRMRDSVRSEAVEAAERAAAEARASGPASSGAVVRDELGGPEVRRFADRLDEVPSGPGSGPPSSFGGSVPDVPEGETVVVRRVVDGIPAYVAFVSGRDQDGNRFLLGAAASLRAAERTVATFRTWTALAVPTLSVLLGVLAALVAGRTLRPVARMRAEADDISHGTLHRRLSPAARSSELAALAATMNDMLDRLERSAIAQRQLVSDVSHELRSPLATIRANLELGGGDEAAVALDEIDRLDGLVSHLLMLSRLDEGARATTEDLDLEDVVAAQAAAVGRSGIDIDTSDVAPARLHGDRRAIVGLVRNLLDNAVRHATRTVWVAVAERDGSVEIVIDDDGPGIPADQHHRVFERFSRLDEGRSRDAGGAGLGLAVAAAAARAQGGSIALDEGPAGGARFRVTLLVQPPS